MASNLRMYRVFIASPGGLPDEREAFRQEMLGYNEAEALQRGIFCMLSAGSSLSAVSADPNR